MTKVYLGFPSQVRAAAHSALVSMNAMISLQTKIEMPEMPEELKPEADPLENYRVMLKSGSQITEYHKGSTKSRHLFCSNDWGNIVLRDPKLKVGPYTCVLQLHYCLSLTNQSTSFGR